VVGAARRSQAQTRLDSGDSQTSSIGSPRTGSSSPRTGRTLQPRTGRALQPRTGRALQPHGLALAAHGAELDRVAQTHREGGGVAWASWRAWNGGVRAASCRRR
jgi:hypothetical protein